MFFRRGRFVFTFLFSLSSAQAQQAFTHEQCRAISAAVVDAVRKLENQDGLSAEFKQSFRNFLGAGLSCTGPREIVWVTDEDQATFKDIRSQLLDSKEKISLDVAGVKLAPEPLRPARQAPKGKGKEFKN